MTRNWWVLFRRETMNFMKGSSRPVVSRSMCTKHALYFIKWAKQSRTWTLKGVSATSVSPASSYSAVSVKGYSSTSWLKLRFMFCRLVFTLSTWRKRIIMMGRTPDQLISSSRSQGESVTYSPSFSNERSLCCNLTKLSFLRRELRISWSINSSTRVGVILQSMICSSCKWFGARLSKRGDSFSIDSALSVLFL